MYAEQLQTPHPHKTGPEELPVSLLSAIDAPAVRARLSECQPEEVVPTQIEEADRMSRIVERTFQYKTRATIQNGLSPEAVSHSQATDCFGYTITLSECLEQANIPHFLGYANGHGFVVLGNGSSHLWMIDPLSPRLNGDMTSSVPYKDLVDLHKQLSQHNRGAVRFNTLHFASSLALKDTVESLSDKNPWMKSRQMHVDPRTVSQRTMHKNHTVILSLFTDRVGRSVFEHTRNFEYYRSTGKTVLAYRALRQLEALYPELDSRNGLPEARIFISDLAAKGYVTLARKAADSVAASFRQEISSDIRLRIWKADRIRDIGRLIGSTELVSEALSLYENEKTQKNSAHIDGKIAKANRILEMIK